MSILSFLGVVALIGIIVNDSLVLVSKYNINVKSGEKVYDAIFNAGISRFRAIFLTTVTTIAGTGEKGTDHEGGNISTEQVRENRCSPSVVLSPLIQKILA